MKKFLIIFFSVMIAAITGAIVWFMLSLGRVSSDTTEVTFNVAAGTSTKEIINNLYDAGLIKSKLASYIYVRATKLVIQSSTYILTPSMTAKEIFHEFAQGNAKENTIRLTFVEGKRLTEYLDQIAAAYGWTKDEILTEISDKAYLESLIKDYWFLDDAILNEKLYYALEGYLYPDTYEFFKTATIKDIIAKMLNQTAVKLEPYKDQITSLNYSVHELLTMASIVEKEAISTEDRGKVAQVIYKRLALKMNLGMDVTSYYGVQKDLKQALTTADLNNNNPYNTRLTSLIGLPVGPICSPSITSIAAVLNPADTDYIYFFADVKTGKVYFTDSYNEFLVFKEKYS